MKDSKPLLERAAQKIARSQNNSQTEAGRPKTEPQPSQDEKNRLVDTINQSFELLRINYHHLYFSAYSEIDALNSAKRLWMESLSPFKPVVILQAVRELIKESDYLLTISLVIRRCLDISNNHSLPDVHSAYIEACRAPSPKKNAHWSHPAVYYAGQKSDWYFLANNTEKTAFPIFKSHYEKLYQQVLNGVKLPEISPIGLTTHQEPPLSKEENIKKMEKMRAELNI